MGRWQQECTHNALGDAFAIEVGEQINVMEIYRTK